MVRTSCNKICFVLMPRFFKQYYPGAKHHRALSRSRFVSLLRSSFMEQKRIMEKKYCKLILVWPDVADLNFITV